MLAIIIALIIVILTNLFLTGLVYYHQKNRAANVYFSVFLFFAAIWTLGDMLLLFAKYDVVAEIGMYLFLLAPMVTTHFVLLFSEAFPADTNVSRLKHIVYAIPTLGLGLAIALNAHWTSTVTVTPAGEQNILVAQKPGFIIYGLFFNVYFFLVYINMIKKYRHSTGIYRTQIFYSLLGIFLASFLAVTTNTALPNYFDNSRYIWLGPVFTLFLSILTSYAILRHKLFDIRPVLARAVAYIAVIITVVLLYISLGAITTQVFVGSDVSIEVQAIYLVFSLLVALGYRPLKSNFDKITNKIFYRDAYDTNEILEKSSSILATHIDLDVIVDKSVKLLISAIHPTHIKFIVFGEGKVLKNYELGDVKGGEVNFTDYKDIKDDMLFTEDKEYQEILTEHDAEVIARLTNKDELIGLVIMGSKQSGSLYSKQDITVLQIISRELAVAVDNARKYEQIQAFNITLQKEVDSATKRLKSSNEELKQMDETKDEFVSMASHQLRTPLTSIKGYISMIIDGDVGKISKEQKKLLEEAFSSSERMAYLIADLLNVSRIQAGTFVVDKAPIHLPTMIKDEMAQIEQMAKAHKLKLVYDEPKDFPDLLLDETKTRQVIMNFIDNAIYYTPENGTITIKLICTKDKVEFTVHDTGIGVPKDEQKFLFDKFYRAQNAKKARPDGTGIGLFMAKKVVVAQGGAIIFKSAEGEGSTFGFTFPLDKIKL